MEALNHSAEQLCDQVALEVVILRGVRPGKRPCKSSRGTLGPVVFPELTSAEELLPVLLHSYFSRGDLKSWTQDWIPGFLE